MKSSRFQFALLAAGMALRAQEFEVASIRPTPAGTNCGTSFDLYEGGRLRIINEPVKLLIRVAFQIQNAQIIGGPSWLDTDRYDIEAKTGRAEKIKPGELNPLIRSLLTERFHLKFHKDTRELTVFALVVAKDRPRLKTAEGEGSAMNTTGGSGKESRLSATGASMALLAGYVGNRLGRIVVDKTGLNGSYDFTLNWAQEDNPSAPSLVTALREQLGLRLESQKSPMEVVVIDGIERPSEN